MGTGGSAAYADPHEERPMGQHSRRSRDRAHGTGTATFYLQSVGATVSSSEILAEPMLEAVIVEDALWSQAMMSWRADQPSMLRRRRLAAWRSQHQHLLVERHKIEQLALLCRVRPNAQ